MKKMFVNTTQNVNPNIVHELEKNVREEQKLFMK